jgi:aminocarboxymuconate-semialdehyde decarboxylase
MTTMNTDRIDVHAHAFPEELLQKLAALYPSEVALTSKDRTLIAVWQKAPLPAVDLEQRTREMDRDGVQIEVLSVPPVYGHFDLHSAQLCRDVNEFQHEAASAFPGRFRGLIHLPFHDPVTAEQELERWSDEPSCVGVLLPSNIAGDYPGHERFSYLWPLLVERGLPAFIHPVAPCGLQSPIAPPVLHFPNDTAIAAASLIYSGVLETYPELRFVLPHYGGTLPMLQSRLDMIRHPHFPKLPGSALPMPPSSYVGQFYVDTAQGFHRPSFDCACAVFGHDRILYGSDYFLLDTPWRAELNRFLEQTLTDATLRHAVLRGNAERLLDGITQPEAQARRAHRRAHAADRVPEAAK